MARKRVSEFEKLKAAAVVVSEEEMPELIADIVGELLESQPSDLGEAIRQRIQDEDRPTGRRLAEFSAVAVALHEAGLIDVSGGLAAAKQTGAAQLRRRTLPAYPVQAERVIAVAQGVEEMDDAVGRVTLADEVFSQRQAAHLEAQKGEAAEIARMRAEAEAAIREFPPRRGCGIGTFLTGGCFSIFWSVSRGVSVRAAWEEVRRAEQRNQSSSAPERAKRQMMAATAIIYVRLLDAGYFATHPKPLPTGPKGPAKFCREIKREYDTTPPSFVNDEADEPEEPVEESESPDFDDEDTDEEVADEPEKPVVESESPAPVLESEQARSADTLHQFLFDTQTGQGFLFAPEHASAKVTARLALPSSLAERRL